jgi:hypothetical protein
MIVKNSVLTKFNFDMTEFTEMRFDRVGQIEALLAKKLANEGRLSYTDDDVKQVESYLDKK